MSWPLMDPEMVRRRSRRNPDGWKVEGDELVLFEDIFNCLNNRIVF